LIEFSPAKTPPPPEIEFGAMLSRAATRADSERPATSAKTPAGKERTMADNQCSHPNTAEQGVSLEQLIDKMANNLRDVVADALDDDLFAYGFTADGEVDHILERIGLAELQAELIERLTSK
jgi:hypothetical protein